MISLYATHNRTCASTLTGHNAYSKQPLWHTSVFLLSTHRKRWYCSFILIHIWNMCKRNICWGFLKHWHKPISLASFHIVFTRGKKCKHQHFRSGFFSTLAFPSFILFHILHKDSWFQYYLSCVSRFYFYIKIFLIHLIVLIIFRSSIMFLLSLEKEYKNFRKNISHCWTYSITYYLHDYLTKKGKTVHTFFASLHFINFYVA